MIHPYVALFVEEYAKLPPIPRFETPVRVRQVLVRDPARGWTLPELLDALRDIGWRTESEAPLKLLQKTLEKGCAKGWAQRVTRGRYSYRAAGTT